MFGKDRGAKKLQDVRGCLTMRQFHLWLTGHVDSYFLNLNIWYKVLNELIEKMHSSRIKLEARLVKLYIVTLVFEKYSIKAPWLTGH